MRRNQGFSLIELLIVVAIIAALVGVAVPFFQDNLSQAQQTKAKQDLDTIRNAITLHDAQNRPMTGSSLKPLIGRYLQELNRDPWGNDYGLDANVGLVISFGADGQAGGTGGDTDHYTFYKPALKIQRCQYDGAWGKPRTGAKWILTMTKQFQFPVSPAASLLLFKPSFMLLTNIRDSATGDPKSIDSLEAIGGASAHIWSFDSAAPGMMNTTDGILALKQTNVISPCGPASISITPTMAVNFDAAMTASTSVALTKFGIHEVFLTGGPLDVAVYGAGAISRQRSPQPIPSYEEGGSTRNRGVKIEKF